MKYLTMILSLCLFNSSNAQPVIWEAIGPHLNTFDDRGTTVEVFSVSPDTFLADVYLTGLFRTIDAGATWMLVDETLSKSGTRFREIISHPDGSLYALLYNPFAIRPQGQLIRSDDRGLTWTVLRDEGIFLNDLDIDTAGAIWIGTNQGLYRFLPESNNLSHISSTPAVIDQLASGENELLIATSLNRLFRSEDNGHTWEEAATFELMITEVVLLDNEAFATVAGHGIFRSLDFGITWAPLNRGLPHHDNTIVATFQGNLLVGTESGVFLWEAASQSWQSIGENNPQGVRSLAADSKLNVVVDAFGIYRFDPAVVQWFPVPLRTPPVNAVLVFPQRTLAATDEGIFLQEHGQASWEPVASPPSHSLGISASGTLLAGYSQGLLRSRDEGENWLDGSIGLPLTRGISLGFSSTGEIYVGTEEAGIFRSIDDGGNWIHLGLQRTAVQTILVDENGAVFAGTSTGGVFRSTNRGTDWVQLPIEQLNIQALAESAERYLFAGSHDAGVYRSMDNGNSWQAAGLQQEDVQDLIVDNRNHIYAATLTGVYLTLDNGHSWHPILSSDLPVYDLSLDAEENLYAASGEGVLRANIPVNVSIPPEKVQNEFVLEHIYPNPFTSSTTIAFQLQEASEVRLTIYDILGREVTELHSGILGGGRHLIEWDATHAPAGIYICRLTLGLTSLSRKLLLVK
jgi:ligand-binding sensor domain-containing protein